MIVLTLLADLLCMSAMFALCILAQRKGGDRDNLRCPDALLPRRSRRRVEDVNMLQDLVNDVNAAFADGTRHPGKKLWRGKDTGGRLCMCGLTATYDAHGQRLPSPYEYEGDIIEKWARGHYGLSDSAIRGFMEGWDGWSASCYDSRNQDYMLAFAAGKELAERLQPVTLYW